MGEQDETKLPLDQLESTGLVKEGNAYSTVLRTRKVGKVFPNGKVALENINLEIHSNSVTTILGHNGAGKTTLINILTCYS